MLRYTVYVDDDRFEFDANRQLKMEEIAERLGCGVENLVYICFEDAD